MRALAALMGAVSVVLALTGGEADANSATALRQDETGLLLAPVFVNGAGPFNFMVDTGANTSGVSRALVQRLALAPRGRGLVHATTGAIEADLFAVSRLRSGDMTIDDATLPAVPDIVLAGAEGILGVDGVKGRRLVIDFETRTLDVSDGKLALNPREWSTQRGRVRFGSLVVTPGKIGRVSAQVILDTGADHSIANSLLAEAIRQDESRRMKRSVDAAVSMAPGADLQGVLLARAIELGEVTVHNMPLDVADLYAFKFWGIDKEPALLLGMDILSKTRAIAIDYRRGSVHFKYPEGEVRLAR
jgi:predicted aspartyl protease